MGPAGLQEITPDQIVFWRWGAVSLNATIIYTWITMTVLVIGSWLITRRLTSEVKIPRWQNLLEVLISNVESQINDISQQEEAKKFLPFIGTLFIFILVSNLFNVIPGYISPNDSLSTTSALAICVFVAIPIYGIAEQGLLGYLKNYIEPTVFMLPFHIMGEISRTLAMAVRLFGNIMSGTKVIAILLAIVPFFFPIVMHLLELLIGSIQAYIFAVLAMVYIASATRAHHEKT